ncbi:hypothetical protein BKA64DRAFT_658576 [Cadophora sp. MPI-SDFR-AT-0126]|nr:hypothetical protein BKA64DRAFT_658576 [Leotiomycetes sp. MPI-SDFR-AT-0126]
MCHQTTYTHTCTHKIKTPRLHCTLASLPSILHSVTKAKVPLLYPCPSCAIRLGQPITYPYPYQVPVAVPAPPPAQPQRVIYQAAPGILYQPRPPPPQQISGPGSHGTPLPAPPNSTTETRLEFSGGAWRPVVHYTFPSASTSPTTAVPPPPSAPVNRPTNLPANQGWSRVHGVDLGPGPPGPHLLSSGNGGHFNVAAIENGNLGWGVPVFQSPAPQAAAGTQASSSSSSTPSSQTGISQQTAQISSLSAPPAQSPQAAPAQTQAGPPPNILAAAAEQAPLPFPSSQTQTPSFPSTTAQHPPAQPTPNSTAHNVRAESLLGMNSFVLARLTTANTDANANGHANGNGNGNGERPASA